MRLISYNIHKGIGGRDRQYKLARTCRVIDAEQPDLLCLQEVTRHAPRTHFHDQPLILAKHFQASGYFFQMNVHYRMGGYGNLLLSRWPFRLQHDVSLRLRRRKPRGAQLVVVDTPEGPLHLANWHLGLTEKERHWQVEHLLRHPQFRESAHLPTLIVGDSNDWRDRLAGKPFAAHAFAQSTDSSQRFFSFPAFAPLLSLDKAFHRGGIVVKGARVINAPLARLASDHLPLVLDFNLIAGSQIRSK